MFNTKQYVLITLFSMFLLILIFFVKRKKINIGEPVGLFLLTWFLMSIFLQLNLVVYDKVFNSETFFVTTTGILAFVFGALLVRKNGNDETGKKRLAITGIQSNILLSMSVLYILIELYSIYQSPINMFNNFHLNELYNQQRRIQLDESKNLFRLLKSILEACAIINAMLFLYYRRKKQYVKMTVAVSCFLMIIIAAINDGTRFNVVFIIALVLNFNYLQYPSKFRRIKDFLKTISIRNVAFLIFGIIFIFYLFVVFPASRNPYVATNTLSALNRHHTSEFGSYIEYLSEMPIFRWLPIFVYGSSYMSHPIVKFTFFIENSNLQNWYAFGQYNFPIIGRVQAVLLGGVEYGRFKIRKDIADISESHGYTTNPWSTGIRDLVIDFGLYFSIVAMFLFGLLSQLVYKKQSTTIYVEWKIFSAFVNISCLTFPFLSPLGLRIFLNPMLLLLTVIFLRTFRIK